MRASISFFLDEITTGGSVQAFFHSGSEKGVFLQQAQGRILHKLLRVSAAVIGDLRKP